MTTPYDETLRVRIHGTVLTLHLLLVAVMVWANPLFCIGALMAVSAWRDTQAGYAPFDRIPNHHCEEVT